VWGHESIEGPVELAHGCNFPQLPKCTSRISKMGCGVSKSSIHPQPSDEAGAIASPDAAGGIALPVALSKTTTSDRAANIAGMAISAAGTDLSSPSREHHLLRSANSRRVNTGRPRFELAAHEASDTVEAVFQQQLGKGGALMFLKESSHGNHGTLDGDDSENVLNGMQALMSARRHLDGFSPQRVCEALKCRFLHFGLPCTVCTCCVRLTANVEFSPTQHRYHGCSSQHRRRFHELRARVARCNMPCYVSSDAAHRTTA